MKLVDLSIRPRRLNESFDKPYPYSFKKVDKYRGINGLSGYVAEASLDDKTNLSVRVLTYPQLSNDEWVVEFSRNGSLDKTGEGDQMRVFATVLAVLREFLNKEDNVRIVTFTAEKGDDGFDASREKLYRRMVKKFTPNNFTVTMDVDDYETVFTLTNTKKK